MEAFGAEEVTTMRDCQVRNVVHANDTLESAELDFVFGLGLCTHALGNLLCIRQVDHINQIVAPERILLIVTRFQHVRLSLVRPTF